MTSSSNFSTTRETSTGGASIDGRAMGASSVMTISMMVLGVLAHGISGRLTIIDDVLVGWMATDGVSSRCFFGALDDPVPAADFLSAMNHQTSADEIGAISHIATNKNYIITSMKSSKNENSKKLHQTIPTTAPNQVQHRTKSCPSIVPSTLGLPYPSVRGSLLYR